MNAMIGAVIGSFDDVGAMLGEKTGETVQRAWIIRQVNSHSHQAAVFDHAAFNDARQQSNIDVAAADKHHYLFPMDR